MNIFNKANEIIGILGKPEYEDDSGFKHDVINKSSIPKSGATFFRSQR
jgi:hypothetical protein